ncbi:hypothetical protein DY102_07080 [Apilactobacillus timberlakei]|uniref:hypothetical protein n=1 Tax=Apilactobacillus timberlakei TaxID=2008380 RepID=UPI00112C44DE|nr:hypothetical protein [Apilactobacillus timberlakei]TPR21447.1 hypothetical protein DY102_07080 [Apilactobacillus timberlakei]
MEEENNKTPYAASSDNSVTNSPTENSDSVAKYGKDYLIESGIFNFVKRNILKIVLEDSTKYSIDEAKQLIERFERDEK